jgi:hypothetical protein
MIRETIITIPALSCRVVSTDAYRTVGVATRVGTAVALSLSDCDWDLGLAVAHPTDTLVGVAPWAYGRLKKNETVQKLFAFAPYVAGVLCPSCPPLAPGASAVTHLDLPTHVSVVKSSGAAASRRLEGLHRQLPMMLRLSANTDIAYYDQDEAQLHTWGFRPTAL